MKLLFTTSLLAVFHILASSGPLSAMTRCFPAQVISDQKISSTQGSFGGALDDFDRFGVSASPLGDLDGDGVVDLVLGASNDDDAGSERGAVWILFLNRDGTVKAHEKISSTQGGFTGALDHGDQFGISVAAIGDLDSDGVVDLAIGAQFDDDGGSDLGAVWILFLHRNGTVKAHQKISAAQGGFSGTLDTRERFGFSVAALGDLDRDGVEDIAVGALRDDDGGLDIGAVWILFLNSDGTVKAHQKISATQGGFSGTLEDGDEFSIVTAIGDLDRDGVIDIAVGAIQDDDGGPERGAVWILFLNSNGTVKAHQKISATQGGFAGPLDDQDRFGRTVAGLADVDRDGVLDLAVGAVGDDDGGSSNRGAVWILLLFDDGTVKSEWKISNTAGGFAGVLDDGDSFGASIASLGDLDGNGILEFAVGAEGDDDGGTNRGAAWVLGLDRPLVLSGPNPGRVGVLNTLVASGAEPNGVVTFYAGFEVGNNLVPCTGSSVNIPIRRIKASGVRAANSDGIARFTAKAPATLAGRTLRIQAVDFTSCQLSNLVVFRF